ncbi:MAG: NAD kinase [Flavobacteriales bacterium]
MNIAVFGKHFDAAYDHTVGQLLGRLVERGHRLRVYSRFLGFLRERGTLPDVRFDVFNDHHEVRDCDLFISIGGDGTILDSVCLVRDSNVPVLGLNTGRLGFLSNVASEEIEEALASIENKKYYLDERGLISVESDAVLFDDFPFALNEITVQKHSDASMVAVHAYMGERFINTYWADGLIVATPTGSTAYSLSCGGPIMMPGSEAFVITPIAPHNLNVRPLVVPNHADLRLSAEGRRPVHRLTLDARPFDLPEGAEVRLSNARFKFNLLNLEHQHFFSTIRNKLLWGLDKRN